MECKACRREINEKASRCRYCGLKVIIGKYEWEKMAREKNDSNNDNEYHEVIKDNSGTINFPLVVTITLSVLVLFFLVTGWNNINK